MSDTSLQNFCDKCGAIDENKIYFRHRLQWLCKNCTVCINEIVRKKGYDPNTRMEIPFSLTCEICNKIHICDSVGDGIIWEVTDDEIDEGGVFFTYAEKNHNKVIGVCCIRDSIAKVYMQVSKI